MFTIKEVYPLENKKERDQFIAFPFDLMINDPNFVGQPRIAQKEMFKKSHPFYETAEVRFFVAQDNNGKMLGRIASVINRHHNEKHNEKVVFFGFSDFVDDKEVSQKLIEKVTEVGKELGMTSLRGPVNPSTNYEAACLVDGFNDPPQIMMTYNPKYYKDHLEELGFAKSMDFYAYTRHIPNPMNPVIVKIAERTEKKAKITYRKISKKTFQKDIETMQELYNASWEDNWGFVPMTQAEFLHTAKDLKQVLDEDFIIFAEIEGKPVGFAVALPDFNQALIKIKNGKLFPFGIWHLINAKKYITRFRVITLGILPEYRKLGLGALLYYKLWKTAFDKGYQECEASWILENNKDMNAAMDRLDGKLYKTYRIYEQPIQQ